MSLFKARDWWTVTCGTDETFDATCLCIGNASNDPSQSEQILVGSHSGVLRVYQPTCAQMEDGTFEGFRPEHVLLEFQMAQAILHVLLGQFVSGSDKFFIATLHPRRISVHSLTGDAGEAEPGTQYKLRLMYEHTLSAPSHCCVAGPFGGVKGQDFLCVQGVDGSLTFFEQENFAFTRYLPEFLLPGPLAYVAKTDSLVTVNTAFHLENFRFQTLAVATEASKKPTDDAEGLHKGKRVVADWSVSIGEEAIDVKVASFSNCPTLILVLGEHTFFAFKPSGELHFLKVLDFTAACFFPYPSSTEGSLMLLMATQRSTLLVYHDTVLKWAAQLSSAPIALARTTIQSMQGAIVRLTEQGQLSCSYLGTDPCLSVAAAPESREYSLREVEQELNRLENAIKSSSEDFPGRKKTETDLKIKVFAGPMSEIPYHSEESPAPTEDGSSFIPSIIVKVHLEASAPLRDVRVMVDVARPLVALNSDVTLTTLLDHHQMAFTVKQAETMLPSSLDLKVVAFYQNSSGASQLVQASMHLPLALVARPCVAERTYEHKLTIETNKPSVPSNELFPDFACDITSQTIGIQFLHGPQASILVSKSSQKYRIQSDNIAVLWIPVLELLRRLHQYYKRASNDETLKCSYSSSLPLQEYFSVIDDYFKIRQEALEVEELLSQRAAQFRVVQKCVLTKLKDKTPTPLNNFDSLLEVTQRELLSLGKRAVEITNEYKRMLSKLSSASQLLILLLKLKTQMSTEDHKLLQDVFHVDLEAPITEGWEEKLEAAICSQLQTGEPDEELPPVPTELTPLKDVTRLKQLIAIMFEKVLDGLRLSQNDPPSRKVDNQSKESNHKEPKPEVFSLDSAATMSSPIPGPSTSKPVHDENDLQEWMADSQETESSNNSFQQNSA
ncbi:protein PTHB1 isoform X1 [Dermacentor albipictus]|uniref:protein PTHB1 isoform X1 n=1 Tax=Dermacentor albipictus TaxID=60249 RepID=UPI0031FD5B4E